MSQQVNSSTLAPTDELEMESLMTHGGQSTVYFGVLKKSRLPVAVKVYEEAEVCEDEYKMLQQLQHLPGIAKLAVPHAIKSHDGSSALVFELLGDDLYQFALSRKLSLSIYNIYILAKQILSTLAALNALGITHNDIKPENIMIARVSPVAPTRQSLRTNRNMQINMLDPDFRLIDFAYASTDNIIAGTCTYYSPEQLANQGGVIRSFTHLPRTLLQVGQKVDVWALGCVLVEMASGLRLFDFSNDTRRFVGIYVIIQTIWPFEFTHTIAEKINNYHQYKMLSGRDLKLIKQAVNTLNTLKDKYPSLFDLLSQMLVFDPSKRITAANSLYHPFITSEI